MDQQDPRVTAERARGRAEEDAVGLEHAAPVERTTARSSAARTPGRARGTSATAPAEREQAQKTREIRADIEQTREDLSETVNAIQERLRPGHIASEAAEKVRTATMDRAREAADSEPVQYVRANPIPTAMVGIGVAGLAWMALAAREPRHSNHRYGMHRDDWRTRPYVDPDLSPGGFERADERSHSGRGPFREDRAYGRVTGWSGRDWRSSGMSGHLTRTWNQNPLLIGAAALVAGAIVGLSAPETEHENRLMGETRDNMMDTVQDTVRDKVSEVQEKATNAVGQVQEIAKGVVGLDSDTQG